MISQFFKSKFFIVVGLVVLVFMSVFLARELERRYQVRKEIKKLENEIATLESQNQEILKLSNYFKTPEYKERQARSLLNLQKPGEFAVALPVSKEESPRLQEARAAAPLKSNFQKWWEYFFNASR